MFGRKKKITQKFIARNDEEDNDENNQNEPKKEKNKNALTNNSENNFIFFGSNNKFSKQLEIYATLKSTKDSNENLNPKNKKLILIVVDSSSPMELLSYKICESFGQLPEYQNLEGLTATNLTKMDEEKKNLPTEGKVGDVLRNGDIICLDLVSNEIWIKVSISMSNVTNKSLFNVSMDVKIKNESSFRELRNKLLKCGIMCYLDKFSKSENKFHYIISQYTISTQAHGNIEENKLKTFDDMKIKQLFTFKNNMKIGIKFYPLEFVLFQKLKTISIPKKEKVNRKKMLWDKFKYSRFKDLLYNKRYLKEKQYIFNYIKQLFKDKTLFSKCYVYSLDEDLNQDITDEVEDSKKEDEKDLSNLNINNIQDERDNIEIDNFFGKNKNISQLNKSILNKSSRSKTSGAGLSTLIFDEYKYTLLVVPPKQEVDDNEKSRNYNSSKYLDNKDNYDDNDFINKINSINTDDNSDVLEHKKRKNSLLNKIGSTKYQCGTLDFEIVNKKELLDDDDLIYKDLKPKELLKKPKVKNNLWGMTNKASLCNDFDNYFDKEKFIDFISGLYLMNIQKGCLEKCTIPNFRGFKIQEKKNILSNTKKRKKKKVKESISYYSKVFPTKRLNFEIGMFTLFIFGILIFLSYLVSNTYY